MNFIKEKYVVLKHKFVKFLDYFYDKVLSPKNILRRLLFWYVIITFFGALLLWAPFSQQDSWTEGISFIDALFISSSAFSDTGLSTTPIGEAFNELGQFLIAFLIIVGGLGWFGIKLLFFQFLLRKTISHKDLALINSERGSPKVGSSVNMIYTAIFVTIGAIFLFGFILSFMFYYIEPSNSGAFHGLSPYQNWGEAFKNGFFSATSAINNAGFTILRSNSLEPYALNYSIQVIMMFLFILGGIGFPIIHDVKEYFKAKHSGENFKFSLITKISTITYISVAFGGWFLATLFEFVISKEDSILANDHTLSLSEQMWVLTFNTFSTRNAGFSTRNITDFSQSTRFIFIIMMFIGSAPSSTTGGIRTTTFAIIILTIWTYIRNRKHVFAFKREISYHVVRQALVIFSFSIIILVLFTLFSTTTLSYSNNLAINDGYEFNFLDLFFELTSAFGTTGLSTGITPYLHWSVKFLIIVMMFIGQLGISTFLGQFGSNSSKLSSTHYPVEDVVLG